MRGCAFSQSVIAFVFFSKMTKGFFELCLWFCKVGPSQSRPVARVRQEETVEQFSSKRVVILEIGLVDFSLLSKSWAS